MTTMNAWPDGRFYRDRDRAVLGGVCAGLARYLGFNLKVTRCLAFLAFLMTMPVAVIAYMAVVFLIPSDSSDGRDAATRRDREAADCCGMGYWSGRRHRSGRRRRSKRRHASRAEEQPVETEGLTIAAEIDRRCQSMDERLARLEKHVTSKRFQIDQELGRL